MSDDLETIEKVRSSVFETNSSSTHSLVVSNLNDLLEQPFSDIDIKNGSITVEQGEFGWEWETYSSVYDKLMYLATASKENPEHRQMICDAVKEHTGLDVIFDDENEGYVDHQSSDVPDVVWSLGVEGVKKFLFNPRSVLETGNDNS